MCIRDRHYTTLQPQRNNPSYTSDYLSSQPSEELMDNTDSATHIEADTAAFFGKFLCTLKLNIESYNIVTFIKYNHNKPYLNIAF